MSDPIELLITLPFPENLVKEVRGISPRLNVILHSANSPEEILAETWEKVEVLYTNNVLPEPESVPNLRWIQFHWAGIDSLIENPLLKKEKLLASTLSGSSASQVAEYVLMMLLALGHHIPMLLDHQAQKEWPDERWERFRPRELRNSTVGIVGYGSIGRQVAKLLSTFGAVVLATKRDAMHPEHNGYTPENLGDPGGDLVHRLYPPQALKAMLKECDFVVITVPLTAETHHLVGAKELEAFKPGAYLIDISRGEVIDHSALVAALQEKKIAGAALDVFPAEPPPADNPLWTLPNVILTPHISGISRRYDERAIELFTENIYRYMADLPLYNLIDLERGY
jgi:phosphoglycerate dehydrogenase-like enzyme